MDLGADLQALDRHVDPGRDVRGLGLDRQGVQVQVDQRLGRRGADDVDRDLDRHLLAAADHDQVDVLEKALDRVALDVLGQRQLVLALDVECEQHVRGLQREHELVAGERDVPRVGAVAVQDGRNLGLATDAAGCALAELGARLGGDTDLGHGGAPRDVRTDGRAVRWSARGTATVNDHRVDHGGLGMASLAAATGQSSGVRRAAQTGDPAGLSCARRTGWSPSRRRTPRGCLVPAAARSRAP